VASRKLIVIGGGPAGLMAAGQAALQGIETLIFEKKDRPGCKLSITGKGRCNLTNVIELSEFIGHFGANGRFLHTAFSRFLASELVTFFEQLGVKTMTERGGRVFPASGQAKDVVDALVQWAKDCGVAVKVRLPVERLLIEDGRVVGVQVLGRGKSTAGKVYQADAVIVAAGGASYPDTGSTGDGYRLAESAGHSIIPIRPALTPIETAGNIASQLQDLNLRNVSVRVRINGKKRAEAFGEMLFTHFGLFGPVILTLSGQIVDALRQNKKVFISIDLKPALDDGKLEARLIRDLEAHGKKKFDSILKGLLPQKLIPVCMEQTDISPDKPGHQITASERKRLRLWLKDFRFEATGYRPFTEAIITAGGVNTREVNPRSMESLLVKGLYFAGEALDIDGDTGGFNLQAAFSTGWLAGQSVAADDV